MRAGRRRHQVLLTLLPGSEPWVLVQAGDRQWKMPAGVSVLELIERLEELHQGKFKIKWGDDYIRVRPEQVLRW